MSDRYLLPQLRQSFTTLATPFRALRRQLGVEAKTGGLVSVQRTYDHWFQQLVSIPRRREYHRLACVVSRRRLARIHDEVRRRHPTRSFPVHPRSMALALHKAFTRTRKAGDRAWRLTDPVWPSDVGLRYRYFTTLDDWTRRARPQALKTLQAASGSSSLDDDSDPDTITTTGANAQPIIDPRHKKIAYPFGPETDVDLVDLVERAADDVVVGRGEYYAAVGVRDLAREVDILTSLFESQHQPVIIGWRWTLSDAHDEHVCPTHICLTFSEADVGHPNGPGVYFDLLFPQSHPNCWCSMEPEWATDEQLADPPVPDEDYSDRVIALTEQFHDMLAHAA